MYPDLQDLLSYSYVIYRYLSAFIITGLVLINLDLLRRYIKTVLGKRVKPDGRKAILITGATSGLGLALSKYFYNLGFSVFACYYNDKEPGYAELKAIQDIEEDGEFKKKLRLIYMDVRSDESIVRAKDEVESLLNQYGLKLFCLINNAGLASDCAFEWTDKASMRAVMDTNLMGTIMVTKNFTTRIVKDKGRVVNVSSIIQYWPIDSVSIYGCTKSAVAYFSASLNRDLQNYGASCTCVLPGNFIINTNIIYSRIRCINKSIEGLSEEEKILYRDTIERYSKRMIQILRAVIRESDISPEEISKIFDVEIPKEALPLPRTKDKKYSKKPLSMMEEIFNYVVGGVKGKSIEELGLLRAYDDAVRLVKPHGRNHAGTYIYTYFTGPLIDHLSYNTTDKIVDFLQSLIRGSNLSNASDRSNPK